MYSKKEIQQLLKELIAQKLEAKTTEDKAYYQNLKEAVNDIDVDWKYRTTSGTHVGDL